MKGHWITYSDAEIGWLEANRLMVISDYHAAFLSTFGRTDVSAVNLHSLRKRRGWATGRTGCFPKGNEPFNKGKPHPSRGRASETHFKKGGLPHNTNYLGHERVSKDGYVEISIAEANPHTGFERRYVLKHRHLWEAANGPIPEGMALKCKSDRLNTDPANWELIPRALLPRLNGGRRKTRLAYDAAPVELKPTLMAMAKLEHGIHEKRKSA